MKNTPPQLAKLLLFAATYCLTQADGFCETFDLGKLDRSANPFEAAGAVSSTDATDIYQFELGSECQVDLLLNGLSGNADLKLLGEGGQVLASSSKKKKQSETVKKLLGPGHYQAVVQWADTQPVNYAFRATAAFVPDDVVASGKVTVQDPEYDAEACQVAWREGTTLFATDINPETGLLNVDARQVVDTGLATVEEVINGPEWTSILGGQPRILYTKSNGSAWSISQARQLTDGTWETTDLSLALWQTTGFSLFAAGWLADPVPDTQNGYKPIGSLDGDESVPLMKFTIGTNSQRDQANAWKELDPPFGGDLIPQGAQAGRFVPGEYALIYSRAVGGFQQLIWYGLRNREETVITDTPIHKVLPFAIKAPEFGGDIVITASETDNIDERGFFDSIGVYREIDGEWKLIKRIASPSEKLRGVHSVEPFVFDGKSYVSFLVLNAISRDEGERKADAEVWIASLDPEDGLLRKVSGSAKLKRSDPESLVTENEVFIYYTEIAKKTYRQHRTKTGLVKH